MGRTQAGAPQELVVPKALPMAPAHLTVNQGQARLWVVITLRPDLGHRGVCIVDMHADKLD